MFLKSLRIYSLLLPLCWGIGLIAESPLTAAQTQSLLQVPEVDSPTNVQSGKKSGVLQLQARPKRLAPAPFPASASETRQSAPVRPQQLKNSLPPLLSEKSLAKPEPLKIEDILSQGSAFEKDKLWSEAMSYYENALKSFGEIPAIQERYQQVRFHYDINRRYHDSTFEELLRQTPLTEILAMFEDVLGRIQANHVDSPQWVDLFRHGLDDLEVALSEPAFLEKNKIIASPEMIAAAEQKAREIAMPWSFRDIRDMRNGVLYVADLINKEIGLSPAAVILEFVGGAANSLDPHSFYLTLRQLNDVYSMIDGCFVGIGVELDSDDRSLVIAKVLPNSPAQQGGLLDGDRILAVNGKSTLGVQIDLAADLLQGESGSTAVLTVQSPDKPERIVRVVRREVEVASVEDVHMINETLGYFRLSCFQTNTTEEIRQALFALNEQGMQALVLDLRQNPGGLLPVAVDVANLFLDEGIIVRTQDRNNLTENVWRATGSAAWSVPLIVLIDEESASASEIFAGAIRDHRRGILIGKQSYGKGTVQVIYRLNRPNQAIPAAGLKLTIERFYSPNGNPFCGVGVSPDIVLDDRRLDGEVVRLAKPDGETGSLPKLPVQPKRRRISSAPSDPFIAEAISASSQLNPQHPQRLSQSRP